MPTYEALAAFQRQFGKLDPAQREAFRQALAVLIADLKAGGSFSPELRARRLVNTEVWSMTFARDGRALFRYGERVAEGEAHIVWEAVGTHAEVYNFKN